MSEKERHEREKRKKTGGVNEGPHTDVPEGEPRLGGDPKAALKDVDLDPLTGLPDPTPKTGTNQKPETSPSQGHRTSRESTGPTGTTGGSARKG